MRNRQLFTGLVLLLTLSAPLLLTGGTAGKISGRVTDARTGDGLIGVNIMIEGSYLGTASGEDGYYAILNVPPGIHALRFDAIGYSAVIVQDAYVAIDLTMIINVQMQSQVLGMQEVIAIASRPVVAKDISNSRLDISAEQIKNLPVQSVTEIIGLQAGIEGMNIRGSGSGQAVYLLDGMALNDERENIPYTTIALSAVKEIQVQTGGFNAEYGNARSGVINVVAREGNNDRYSGQATLQYRPPAPKHRGPSAYASDTYFTRPFIDPDVCWTGTSNGVWDRYQQNQYVPFEGFNSVSQATLEDDDPTNDLTPAAVQQLWKYYHRRQGDIIKPDYNIDMGFGGPVPVLNDPFGNLRFFASYKNIHEMFIVPLYRDSYDEQNLHFKLTADISNKMKLTLSGLYGELYSICPDQWQIPPSGAVLRRPEGVADRASAIEVLYMPDYYTPTDIYRNQWGAKLTHLLSDKEFYELSISVMNNRYHTYATPARDTTLNVEILSGLFVDEAPYGYYPKLSDAAPGGILDLGGWMGFGRDNSRVVTGTFKGNYTNQWNYFNQLKTGFELVITDFDIHSALEHPYSMQWRAHYDRVSTPYRLGIYIQNKVEFESLVINAGLRWDYSNANSDWYELVAYDTLLNSFYGEELEELAPMYKSKAISALNPRLAISHPITEDSKLYFNYGHFNSLASSEYRFNLHRSGYGQVSYLGDPGLPYSRTIAYELGYEHNIFRQYLFKLAGYYKDISNQPSWTTYISSDESVGVIRAGTDSYEDIRGFEITLQKNHGEWFYGFINYTYMVQTSGYFGMRYLYENRTDQIIYEKNNPYQERPVPQPYFRANLNFHSPAEYGKVLGDWNLNLLTTWKAGRISTYNPANLPNLIDNVQYRDYFNIDLRLNKNFKVGPTDIEFFVDVSNLLNTLHFSTAGYSDFNDRIAYMESLHFDWEEGIQNGDDRIGDYRVNGTTYIPMQSVADINKIESPEPRVLYYDLISERYLQYSDDAWIERSKSWVQNEVIEPKAYIDMPNLTYFTFLYLRDITFGIKVSF